MGKLAEFCKSAPINDWEKKLFCPFMNLEEGRHQENQILSTSASTISSRSKQKQSRFVMVF